MSRARPTSPIRSDRVRTRGLVAWVMFGALLIGQVGFGPGLLSIGEALGRGACESSCRCDDAGAADPEQGLAALDGPALADVGTLRASDGLASDDPGGDALDAPCPPSCDDCTCCPGAVPVILSAGFAVLRPALALPVARPPPEMPVTGVMARVFRPPEPCPS